MTKDDMNLVQKDLDEVARKWGIKNAAFCGSTAEGEFVGSHVGEATILSFWETSLNVGRLWQHMRNKCRSLLNEYETGKGW